MKDKSWVASLPATMFLAVVFCGVLAAQQEGPLPKPAAPAAQQSSAAPQESAPSKQPAPAPSNTDPAKPADVKPADPKSATPHKILVPSGTRLALVLENSISTKQAKPGDPVYMETTFPVVAENQVVIPVGSYVAGEIVSAKRAGRVKGRAELSLKLTTMILPNGYSVNLAGTPTGAGAGGGETVDKEGKIKGDSDKASDVGMVVKGTAIGAGIGAIASRSAAGAGMGAGIGAAAGLAAVLLSRGPDAQLPRGSTVDVMLDRPLYLDSEKVQFTSTGTATPLSGPASREPTRSKIPF